MPQAKYIQLLDKLVPIDVAIILGLIALTACAWLIHMILAWLIPMILGRMKWTIRGWISRALRKEQGKSNFLQLPPELRLQVYSYLPLPASHSLRQMNRQINDEIEYEQRKEFERRLGKIQTRLVDFMELRHSTPIKPFEVNLVFRIVSYRHPMAISGGPEAIKKYLRDLPTTTRSINITIESALDVPGTELNNWFFYTYDMLCYHIFRADKAVRTGRMRLRSYKVVCPLTEDIWIPLIPIGIPPWITTLGIAGMIDTGGNSQSSVILSGTIGGFLWFGSACVFFALLELLLTSQLFRCCIIALWCVCIVCMVIYWTAKSLVWVFRATFWTAKWLVWIVKSLARNLVNWIQDVNT
jgi:hypothetical protein